MLTHIGSTAVFFFRSALVSHTSSGMYFHLLEAVERGCIVRKTERTAAATPDCMIDHIIYLLDVVIDKKR